MESTKPIDGDPDIVITWLDSSQDMNFRLPPGEESDEICGGKYGSCGIGKSPLWWLEGLSIFGACRQCPCQHPV
jgi:hypothetical protein